MVKSVHEMSSTKSVELPVNFCILGIHLFHFAALRKTTVAFVRSGRSLVLRWGLPILGSGLLGPFHGINPVTPVKVSPTVVDNGDMQGIRR